MNDGFPAVETMSAPEARAVIVGRRLPVDNLDDVARADDQLIPGPGGDIPVRIYRPHGHSETRTAVVFCHGGGFVLCDLESHDRFCQQSHHRQVLVSPIIDPTFNLPATSIRSRYVDTHAANAMVFEEQCLGRIHHCPSHISGRAGTHYLT